MTQETHLREPASSQCSERTRRTLGCDFRRELSRSRHSHRINLTCERLEDRQLLSADAATISLSQIRVQPSSEHSYLDFTGPTSLTPNQIRNAYEISRITFSRGRVPGNGAGQTIAIVVAYHHPNISSDLVTFDEEFGLPAPPSFTVHN